MVAIKSVAVFCGASMGSDPLFRESAVDLGAGLARQGLRLIYGGGGIGLMGVVANAALDAGGRVTGIIPDFLRRREAAHPELVELEVTDSMHGRKLRMSELADAFVAIPGGLGTLDELIEILTWKQLGLHDKPIFICDVAGSAAPLLRMEAPAAPALVPEDMSAEREKIVSMIESGRLTAEEGAELLQALGASRQQPAARPVMLTGGQRLVLVGAAMVTLGFFLPWFILDSGAEAGRMVNQMQKSLGSAFAGSGIQMPGGMGMPEPVLNAWRVSVNGGGVAHGLGVAVLALALAAALLPYFALALDAATARAIRLLCLGAGGVILLYLLSQNVRAAGIGLMVVMAGYAVQAAALLRDRHPVVTGAGRPVAEHGL